VSAGLTEARLAVSSDLELLAPKFREAVRLALLHCAARKLDAKVHEAYRSSGLQALYYARGRSIIPPPRPVTNARSNLFSWHGYCLAVDVISRSRGWNAESGWFEAVAESFRLYGCRWGGEWKMKDLPHFQWGLCRPSPSPRAREILRSAGLQAVWTAVGAA
jgi:hypothetical protein